MRNRRKKITNCISTIDNAIQKSGFWQEIRGICILAVVMIHCPNAASYAVGSIEFNIWLILRQCINSPVAIFIFLSGYFTNIKEYETNFKAFICKGGGY